MHENYINEGSRVSSFSEERRNVSSEAPIFLKEAENQFDTKNDDNALVFGLRQSGTDRSDDLTEVESQNEVQNSKLSRFDNYTKAPVYKASHNRVLELKNKNDNSSSFSKHRKNFLTHPFNKRDFMVGIVLEPVFVNNAYYVRRTAILFTSLPDFKDFSLPAPTKNETFDKNSIWNEIEQSPEPPVVVSINEYFKSVMLYKKTFNSFSSLLKTLKKYIPEIYEASEKKKFVFTYKIKPKAESIVNFLAKATSISDSIQIIKPDARKRSGSISRSSFESRAPSTSMQEILSRPTVPSSVPGYGTIYLSINEYLYKDELIKAHSNIMLQSKTSSPTTRFSCSSKDENSFDNDGPRDMCSLPDLDIPVYTRTSSRTTGNSSVRSKNSILGSFFSKFTFPLTRAIKQH
ncbi:hypothetical protein BB560_002768 [Smittium megazygosporum]|uniref:Uncharacterized protein n=1 Tax=Smittium megazygosporum TaxID=133381 RepID=A0A2T9ZDT5_9FUNG|nr:hypothetical protein BB560_002768 [Smittium megazygosporum]